MKKFFPSRMPPTLLSSRHAPSPSASFGNVGVKCTVVKRCADGRSLKHVSSSRILGCIQTLVPGSGACTSSSTSLDRRTARYFQGASPSALSASSPHVRMEKAPGVPSLGLTMRKASWKGHWSLLPCWAWKWKHSPKISKLCNFSRIIII